MLCRAIFVCRAGTSRLRSRQRLGQALPGKEDRGYTAIVRWRESLTYGDRMSAKIINRGRGPEIEGTRITVYDVLDYARHGWHRDRIAALFRLSSRDIQAALDYIDQHQDEVTANYQSMRAR